MSDDQAVRKILVVDDEPEVKPMFRQRMRREIRAGRYEFLFTKSGVEALQVLDENPDVRLVITDINMPQMNGLVLLERLGEMWPGLPAVVVSAYGDDENQASAMDRGAYGFVVKPVDFDGLRGTMSESMAESG